MAKKSKKEIASEYVESLLALVPENAREAVKAGLVQDQVLDHLGEHVLMRSEFSRAMDEARQVKERAEADEARYNDAYAKNLTWRSEKEKDLEAMNKLKEKGVNIDTLLTSGGNGAGNGSSDADRIDMAQYAKKSEISQLASLEAQKIVGQREAQYAGFVTTLQDISNRHMEQYHVALDTTSLVTEARKRNQPLDVVYADLTRDLSDRRATEQVKIEKDKQEAEINRRVQEALSRRSPYPTDGGDEPSTLAGLAKKDDTGAEAATRAFYAAMNK